MSGDECNRSEPAGLVGVMDAAATEPASLLARISAGDPQAFSDLVQSHVGSLLAFAARYAGDGALGEDAVQDVLAQAFRTLQRKSEDELGRLAIRPWLFRCTINRVRRLRRQSREATAGLRLEPAGHVPSAEEQAGQRSRVQAVDQELRKLPPDWRAAVLLRHQSGYGYQEVAQMLGRPEGTVKAWPHRGVRQARAALERQEEGEND